jgi:hypothetical protein
MALKLLSQFARLCIIYVDQSIITASDDLVLVKLKTRDNVMRVRGKSDMAWLHLSTCPAVANHVMPSIQGLVKMKLTEAWQAKLRVWHCSCRRAGC